MTHTVITGPQIGMSSVDNTTESSMRRVIESFHENLGERITIDDMARTAMFSKFHFTRIFQRATGLSPGRFLSAMRLQEAKRLLLTTRLSVTDICTRVGYSSVGTFSSRFKSSVGLSPTAYRELNGFTPRVVTDPAHRRGHPSATVHGEVIATTLEETGPVFLGLFPEPIPQGAPVRCAVLDAPGKFELDGVPQGTWYLLAQSVTPGTEHGIGDRAPLVGSSGPLAVRMSTILAADVHLRPMTVLDPPVLMALLDVRRDALKAIAS